MKNVFLFLGILILFITVSSCKKDYTCECVTTVVGIETERVSTNINNTKNKAEDQCEDMSFSTTSLGINTTKTCRIK